MKKLFLETDLSKVYILIASLFCMILLGSYFSYAMFTVSKEKSNAISIVTGNLTYDLKIDGISTNELIVASGETKIFTITLTNPNSRTARFNFYYKGTLDETIEAGYLVEIGVNTPPSASGINLETTGVGSTQIYKIKVTNSSDKEIALALGVEVGLDYNDLTLPTDGHLFEETFIVNVPKLENNMIPVIYKDNNWQKADPSNWYNYEAQEWANAVTVSSATLASYQSASVGTPISMDDIETMWVWIPRYSYTIGSVDGTNYYGKQGDYLDSTPTQELPGEIDTKFIKTTEKDRGTAKYIVSEGINDTSWYTPDAFTFDGEELSGIWVGKFETSSSNPSASNGGGNVTNLDPLIKPNVTSWRGINVSNIYTIALKMNDEGNRYGFSSNVDTHAMKNSEWGAVTYLSQSKYGKLGNTNFTGANKEIYQNKSDQYITGCSWGKPSGGTTTDYGCQYTYDIQINGTGASTTGNIYGVYDMSGGAWDYMMSNYNDSVGESGFINLPELKYYDKYTTDNLMTACAGKVCLSHSLSETVGWYNDYSSYVSTESPWYVHGCSHNDQEVAGLYCISGTILNGRADVGATFRLVIS